MMILKDFIFEFDRDTAQKRAFERFKKICHFDEKNKLLEEAMAIAEKIYDDVDLKAIVTEFDRECIRGEYIIIEDVEFHCGMLSEIKNDEIMGIYGYILTAGEDIKKGENLVEEFYFDAMRTGYVDCCRDMLKEKIAELGDGVLSDSVAPGFYGMGAEEIGKFFKIIDGNKIGVKVNESGFMMPSKSCVGFYIRGKSEITVKKCRGCMGEKNCEYCRYSQSN